MSEASPARPSQDRSAGVLAVRYGIPTAFIVAGQVVLIATGDAVNWAGLTGAGLAVLLIGFLFRIGAQGDAERDREEEARAYFSKHGKWPDEKT